jgi:phospholipase/carboxylesterase
MERFERDKFGQRNQTHDLVPLHLGEERDGFLYVPRMGSSIREMPLLLVLHEAGGNAHDGLIPFVPLADRSGTLLLAPDSRQENWEDTPRIGLESDQDFIERAMEKIAESHRIQARHTGVLGFAEGASFALSLGIRQGSRFSHVISLSPGRLKPVEIGVAPKIFIAHGKRDPVTPAEHCGRPIALYLERMGFEVCYFEFEGGHVIDPAIVDIAMAWFLSGDIDSFAM